MPVSSPKVITRADDLGGYAAALPAFQEAVEGGVLKNLSVMASGLSYGDAAPWLREVRGVDIGLHICLNAEFHSPQWGPLIGKTRGASLVDENGFFLKSPHDLNQKGFSLDEAEEEIRTQFQRMVDDGIRVSYMDDHMGVSWLPGLRDRIAAIAKEKGVLYDSERKMIGYGAFDNLPSGLLDQLVSPQEEARLLITHPALDGEEMRSLMYDGAKPGSIAEERDQDRRFFTDPRVIQSVRDGLWQPVRWTEA